MGVPASFSAQKWEKRPKHTQCASFCACLCVYGEVILVLGQIEGIRAMLLGHDVTFIFKFCHHSLSKTQPSIPASWCC